MCKGSVATFLWDRFCEFSKLNAPQSNYYSMSRFSPPNRTKRDADMSRDDTGFARVLSYAVRTRLGGFGPQAVRAVSALDVAPVSVERPRRVTNFKASCGNLTHGVPCTVYDAQRAVARLFGSWDRGRGSVYGHTHVHLALHAQHVARRRRRQGRYSASSTVNVLYTLESVPEVPRAHGFMSRNRVGE